MQRIANPSSPVRLWVAPPVFMRVSGPRARFAALQFSGLLYKNSLPLTRESLFIVARMWPVWARNSCNANGTFDGLSSLPLAYVFAPLGLSWGAPRPQRGCIQYGLSTNAVAGYCARSACSSPTAMNFLGIPFPFLNRKL